MKSVILNALGESRDALATFMDSADAIARVEAAATVLITALESGNAIYSCGNGGSMSDAMHFAEELTGRYRDNRGGLAATAISDPGHLSCVANDYGYEFVFSRYIEARGKTGDVLLGISTSGSSRNVITAARSARQQGLSVISLTGAADSELGQLADVDVSTVGAPYADRVQEIHIKVLHIFIELIERHFFAENYS